MTQRSPRIRQPVLAGLAAAVVLAGCDTLPLWMVAQGRSQITDHRHFDNAPIAAAAIPRAWSRAPQPLRWPRGESTEVMEQRAAGVIARLSVRPMPMSAACSTSNIARLTPWSGQAG